MLSDDLKNQIIRRIPPIWLDGRGGGAGFDCGEQADNCTGTDGGVDTCENPQGDACKHEWRGDEDTCSGTQTTVQENGYDICGTVSTPDGYTYTNYEDDICMGETEQSAGSVDMCFSSVENMMDTCGYVASDYDFCNKTMASYDEDQCVKALDEADVCSTFDEDVCDTRIQEPDVCAEGIKDGCAPDQGDPDVCANIIGDPDECAPSHDDPDVCATWDPDECKTATTDICADQPEDLCGTDDDDSCSATPTDACELTPTDSCTATPTDTCSATPTDIGCDYDSCNPTYDPYDACSTEYGGTNNT